MLAVGASVLSMSMRPGQHRVADRIELRLPDGVSGGPKAFLSLRTIGTIGVLQSVWESVTRRLLLLLPRFRFWKGRPRAACPLGGVAGETTFAAGPLQVSSSR